MDAAQDPKQAPHVVAVILTWEDVDMTTKCAESVIGNDYPSLETVIVDNGSKMPVMGPLTEAFPTIHPIPLDRNYGFTGGCNRGMEKALEMGADYVFLLNNDTVVHPQAIKTLVAEMEADAKIGMASAMLLNPEEDRTMQPYKGTIYRDKAWVYRPGDGEPFTEAYQKTYETEFASACAVMFRREALEQVGLFDEALFTNWEDYDLCIRLTDAGWKLVVVGSAEVVHRRHQTTGATSPFIVYFSVRNKLICLWRHGRPLGILGNTIPILRWFWFKIKSHGLTSWACHRAMLKAIFHFLIGVRGEGGAPKSRKNAR